MAMVETCRGERAFLSMSNAISDLRGGGARPGEGGGRPAAVLLRMLQIHLGWDPWFHHSWSSPESGLKSGMTYLCRSVNISTFRPTYFRTVPLGARGRRDG